MYPRCPAHLLEYIKLSILDQFESKEQSRDLSSRPHKSGDV